MAIVSLKCPGCNNMIELDNTNEFGFCKYCGAKIAVGSAQSVKPVAADPTGADVAFRARNFAEAYDAYSAIVRSDAGAGKAAFRKGLCAAYLSTPDNVRVNELFSAIDSAKTIALRNSDPVPALSFMQKETIEFAENFFASNTTKDPDDKYDGSLSAKAFYESGERSLALILYALALLDNNMIATDAKIEDYYKAVIDRAIEAAAKCQKNITYLVGTQTVKDKDGKLSEENVYKKLSSPYDKEMKDYTQRLKNIYNNLPGTLGKIADYDKQLAACQNAIDDFENSLKAFFLANPDDEKQYRRPGLFGKKKKRGEIEEKFSPELRAKKDAAEKAEDDIDTLTKAKKQFISDNTKK